MPRPGDIIPQWAQAIVNYLAPGKPWDGFPNKVRPALSVIGNGWAPSQRLPIPIFNWLLGMFGLHLAHLDAIEAQNWNTETSVGAFLANQSGKTVAWDPVGRKLYMVGPGAAAGLAYTSANGVGWQHITVPAFSNLGTVVVNPVDGVVVFTALTPGGPGTLYYLDQSLPSPSWSTVTPGGAKTWKMSVWSPNQSTFLFSGVDNSNHPTVYLGDAHMTTVTAGNLQGASGYIGEVNFMAASTTGIQVAFSPTLVFPSVESSHAWKINGDPSGQWTDLGNIYQVNGGWITADPADLAWDDSRQVFVCVAIDGSTYQSANGQDWAQVGPPMVDPLAFQYYTLAVNGGLYVAMVGNTQGQPPALVYSVDGGATWAKVAFPFISQAIVPASMALVDDRFALMSQDGRILFSLRLH